MQLAAASERVVGRVIPNHGQAIAVEMAPYIEQFPIKLGEQKRRWRRLAKRVVGRWVPERRCAG